MSTVVFTIGHSNHTLEKILSLLGEHHVTAVADVRSAPYSRFNPSFNRERLHLALKEHGIQYVFLGAELGARSKDPSCYEGGRVQYRRLAQTDLFKSGLQRVVQGAHRYRVALLCAEKEPLDCHRTILVARELEAEGFPVAHIHADGRLEPHTEAVRRLFRLVGLPEADLFRSQESLIEEAYGRQEARIAYVDRNDAASRAEEPE